jgi:hypothetical protein
MAFFDAHITICDCQPRTLFRYDQHNKWVCIKKHAVALSALMDATSGRIPTQFM